MKSRFDFDMMKEDVIILDDLVSSDNFKVILLRLKGHDHKLFVKNHFVGKIDIDQIILGDLSFIIFLLTTDKMYY